MQRRRCKRRSLRLQVQPLRRRDKGRSRISGARRLSVRRRFRSPAQRPQGAPMPIAGLNKTGGVAEGSPGHPEAGSHRRLGGSEVPLCMGSGPAPLRPLRAGQLDAHRGPCPYRSDTPARARCHFGGGYAARSLALIPTEPRSSPRTAWRCLPPRRRRRSGPGEARRPCRRCRLRRGDRRGRRRSSSRPRP